MLLKHRQVVRFLVPNMLVEVIHDLSENEVIVMRANLQSLEVGKDMFDFL